MKRISLGIFLLVIGMAIDYLGRGFGDTFSAGWYSGGLFGLVTYIVWSELA